MQCNSKCKNNVLISRHTGELQSKSKCEVSNVDNCWSDSNIKLLIVTRYELSFQYTKKNLIYIIMLGRHYGIHNLVAFHALLYILLQNTILTEE